MITITLHAYTIDEHPEPAKVYDWIRGNWYDLMEPTEAELLLSLKKLAEHLDLELDYCFGSVPDRGEHITLKGTYSDADLKTLVVEDCPLTGCYWDAVVIDALQAAGNNDRERIDITSSVLKVLHSEHDYQYSDEGLKEHCLGNNYHFLTDGSFHPQ